MKTAVKWEVHCYATHAQGMGDFPRDTLSPLAKTKLFQLRKRSSLKKRFALFWEMVSKDSVRLWEKNFQNCSNENREIYIFSTVLNELKYIWG